MSSDSEGLASIIIIDPSSVTRVIVDVCLRREDVTCTGFSDGASAFHALQTDPQWIPRVIVLELAFPSPGIDGCALIRLLRVSSRLDKTAIVVLSTRSGLGSRLRARLAGANEYLTKPFKRNLFLSVILPYTQQQEQPLDQDAPGLHPGREEQHAARDRYPGAARDRFAS